MIGPEYRVGRDAHRVVIRQAGEESRPEHGQECGECAKSRRPELRESPHDSAPDVLSRMQRCPGVLTPATGDAVEWA